MLQEERRILVKASPSLDPKRIPKV